MTAPVVGVGAAGLDAAERALRDGAVVGLPTDTVYGVAALASVPGATGGIFRTKGRPRAVTLPVLVADVAQAETLVADIPAAVRTLLAQHWPGGLTVVLDRAPGFDADLGDDDGSVGVRVPAHPVVRELARRVGPIATTSANRHGQEPATEAGAVAALPGVALVLDGGTCAASPSTVVDARREPLVLLRAGTVPWTALRGTGTPET